MDYDDQDDREGPVSERQADSVIGRSDDRRSYGGAEASSGQFTGHREMSRAPGLLAS